VPSSNNQIYSVIYEESDASKLTSSINFKRRVVGSLGIRCAEREGGPDLPVEGCIISSRYSNGTGVPTGLGKVSAGSTISTCSTSPSSLFCHESCTGSCRGSSAHARIPYDEGGYCCLAFPFDFFEGIHSDSGFPDRNAHHISLSFLSGINRRGPSFVGPTCMVG